MNFIKATEEFNTFESYVSAPYLRKTFNVNYSVKANVKIAACGFYEFYINGKNVTKGLLAPYISNPDHYVYYDEYEVNLDEGENVIGLILGNGFQNNPGGYIWKFDTAAFRSAPLVALVLTYKDSDGKDVIIESDTSFKTAPSPIRSDDYRFGEVYDANYEIKNWNLKGFDDSDWANALSAPTPRGELRLCTAEPIVMHETLKPVNIFASDGGYIYDFGISHSGVCKLTVNGSVGQRISMQHSDAVKDGKLILETVWMDHREWERDKPIVHKDVYICKGEGTEVYMPRFTYHGFRYVKVEGITEEQVTPELLTFIVCYSDLKIRGGFNCSDETVNKLQQMTLRSDLSNFYYFPNDCPHREKNGWTADIALSSEHMLLNFNPEVSFREWMYNVYKAQNKDGAIPGIIPTTGWGFDWGNGPAWDCVLVYLPYFVYKYRGETEMIRESAGALMHYLHYLTTRVDEKGLIHIGLPDWKCVGRHTPVAPLELTDSIMSMDIANKAAFLFNEVGMIAQAEFAQKLADGFKSAIRNNLIDFGTMTAAGNCQTSQAMSIFYGVFTEAESVIAVERLIEFINDKNGHFDVGVLGARVIFHVLSKYGYSDLAYSLITHPEFPSYAYWIKRGATTLWEDHFPDSIRGSMNHHFWGDISAWFIKCLAGIQFNPLCNDVSRIDIAPSFVDALDFAEAYYEAPLGKISSSWKREDDKIILKGELPPLMNGTVSLKNNYLFEDGTSFKNISGSFEFVVLKRGTMK